MPTVADKIDTVDCKVGDQLRLITSFGTGVDHIDLPLQGAWSYRYYFWHVHADTADVTMAYFGRSSPYC